jgi:putative ABC transport system ATP-binding protein
LTITAGEFVVIMGPSGSGKSTLLQMLGALDQPTSGHILFQGKRLTGQDDRSISLFRRESVGFVFQSFHLLPTLSAAENVSLPLMLAGQSPAKALPRAQELLKLVALDGRAKHRPSQLSGGQMQRVAVARALAADPPLILADEPTGNLDTANGLEILRILQKCQQQFNRTIIMVTHDQRAIRFGTRIVELEDGRIVRDERVVANDVGASRLD